MKAPRFCQRNPRVAALERGSSARMADHPFPYFKTSRDVIELAVIMPVRYPLSLRNVGDLLRERGIDLSHESIRFWVERFGPYFAREIRRKRTRPMRS
jgi:putative transposase